jgi:DUF4097 and DUF4098 domain-containing protein YvlB
MKPRSYILAVLIAFISLAPLYARERVREEFHQTYPLSQSGTVSLENVNGDVYIAAWDKNEVKVDAVKTADSSEALAEARIVVDANSDSINIETKYPRDDYRHNHNHAASVEYRLTVPKGVNLNSVELVNGTLEVTGVKGEVNASCVNGELKATGLHGKTELETVNGRLEAVFEKLDNAQRISMSSVNGSIDLTVPANANAQFDANTVSGSIRNDFGFEEEDEHFVGHELSGRLGNGSTRVKLSNVNGAIRIRKP